MLFSSHFGWARDVRVTSGIWYTTGFWDTTGGRLHKQRAPNSKPERFSQAQQQSHVVDVTVQTVPLVAIGKSEHSFPVGNNWVQETSTHFYQLVCEVSFFWLHIQPHAISC